MPPPPETKNPGRAQPPTPPRVDHATTASATDNETGLDDAGKYCDRFSSIQQILRNRFFARRHDLIEDARGFRGLIGGCARFPGAPLAVSLCGYADTREKD